MTSESPGPVRNAREAEAPGVLVACDDPWMGQVLEALLGDAGYRALPVKTGAAVLERLQGDDQPCVVLLSLRWHPLNSQDILEAVAADAALAPRHTFVLLTALWDMLPADYVALLRRLDVPVVPKPFQMEELLKAVARAVGRLETVGRPLSAPSD